MTNGPLADERRVFDRFSARFPAKITDSREEYGEKLYLSDASAQGAKITTTEKMFMHDSVILDVMLGDHNYPMTLKGQVVWIKSVQPNIWDVGLKFHKINLRHMSRLYQLVEPAV